MTVRKLYFFGLLVFFVVGIGMFFSHKEKKIDVQRASHTVIFFDNDSFFKGVTEVKDNSAYPYHVRGGIIPHHLLPSKIIADFFERLSTQQPKTLIIIGPNHYEKGTFKVLTSRYDWETPFGLLHPNEEIIDDLIQKRLLQVDEEVLPNDHAVAGILPFVKYYLPDTTIVPMLLSGKMNEQDVRLLAEGVSKHLDRDTVLVAAVDFSHYLTNQEAQEKDAVTLSVLKQYDYQRLLLLNNDYLDSPPSIAALLMTMRRVGALDMEVLHHTNSGEMLHNNKDQTTSYFGITYY